MKHLAIANQFGRFSAIDIRRALIETHLVDSMVAMSSQVFCSTQIAVYLWFVPKNKNAEAKRGFRHHVVFDTHLALAA